eukprot:31000-Pelagococcus_subviridis.AAC.13
MGSSLTRRLAEHRRHEDRHVHLDLRAAPESPLPSRLPRRGQHAVRDADERAAEGERAREEKLPRRDV